MSAPPAERVVPCPTCRGPAVFGASNRWRPFCGERCRSVDLGAWASERFRVQAENPAEPATNAPRRSPDEGGAGARH